MPRVLITDADAKQLRTFGKIFLGLDIEGNETINQMKSKLQTAGYEHDYIVSAEPEAQQPEGVSRPVSYREVKMPSGEMQKQVCIQIESANMVGGDRPVPVGVNGQAMLIPRGRPVWVPESYEEVLRNAVEDHYDQTDSGLGTPHKSRSYPYSIATPTPSVGTA